MARYKLTLAYDGSAFQGSQRQPRARTVQGELERAARVIGWSGNKVLLAGRTDTGVHAGGQVAAFDIDWMHGPEALRRALNASLPRDLAVVLVEGVQGSFHPRYDAIARTYRYRVRVGEQRDPLHDRMVWRIWPGADSDLLDDTAALLVGRHDFGAFGSAPHAGGGTERSVEESRWTTADGEMRYLITADGFLHRMVRRLVFVQVAVAQGKCTVETLKLALRGTAGDRRLPSGTAPAEGLSLIEVRY